MICLAFPSSLSTKELQKGIDVVTFTSPSTVLNFSALAREAGLDPHNLPGNPIFVCIGPITAEIAKELRLPVSIIPKQYTIDSLIDSLMDYYSGENIKHDN